MRDLWRIYDALIDGVADDQTVSEVLCGLNWFAVRALGVGLSMAPGDPTVLPAAGSYARRSAHALAGLSKSWNGNEAAIGMAAINSSYNAPEAVAAAFGPHTALPDANIFDLLTEEIRGRKVTVIGHFPNLEPWRAICDLTVLERKPQPGDTPDPACEWVLPEQDVVVATATTLINKTLPRLLELAPQATFVLAGPTTPLTPKLFDFGIDMLAGLVVEDPPSVMSVIREGGQHRLFQQGGRMVTVRRDGNLRR